MRGAAGTVMAVLAAIYGAAGVALAAAAAHIGGETAATAAHFLLFHAPVLLVIPVALKVGLLAPRTGAAAGLVIAAGVFFFSGALALGALANWRPFPMLAPAGGMLMIGGWLLVGVSVLMARARG